MEPSHRYLTRTRVTEPFHDPHLLRDIWGAPWGVINGTGTLRKVLVHRPGDEVLKLHRHAEQIESGPVLTGAIHGRSPHELHGQEMARLDALQEQHDALTVLLHEHGVETVEAGDANGWPERLFVRDSGMVVPGGVIIPRFALYIRYGEAALAARTFHSLGMPVLGMVQGSGFAEGGSFTMLDARTAVIGRSERVNAEGIRQIGAILDFQNVRLLAVDLPSTIIHLDEAFLMVDRRKALVNTALLPFWFLDELHNRQIELLHADPSDHPLSINGLVLGPGKVLLSDTACRTIELLDRCGVEVIPAKVTEFFKLGGGIHCLTLPLIRDHV
ncbi:dimethylarginine dimethylaminohydrolase family protein [Gorillibacterium sp. sgz5001074]|uniref:dimethylarginine dimethylaminohydrolase family protein n=1 Tax=Gorillibacterium sp. sgz5001074 TaxID=3446695 RepID=UPI003F674F74